jgi:hypothetical protein
LLMLNGHKSHVSGDFELYCKKHNIITLYMPAHSSHIFQPLDVACFGPLKQVYGKMVEKMMRRLLTHIAKEDFLPFFKNTFVEVFIHKNIQSGFRGAGIVPFDPESVVSKLDVRLRTPTPPGSSEMDAALWVSKMPSNPTEAHSQSIFLKKRVFEYQDSSPTSILAAIDHFAKGTKMIMHKLALVETECAELREANKILSRRRRTKKTRLQDGKLLNFQKGQDLRDLKDVAAQIQQEERQNGSRARRVETRPRRCGICNGTGHNARTCQTEIESSGEEDSE